MRLSALSATRRQLARWLRPVPPCGGLVLMYHRIADDAPDPWGLCVTPAHFEQHLEVLRRFSHPLSLTALTELLADRRLPPRTTVVTFDDGYADNLSAAKPLLARHDVPATVFVTSGYTDGRHEFWWDELERALLRAGTVPPTLEMTIDGTEHAWDIADDAIYTDAAEARDRGWRWREPPPTRRHHAFLALYRLLQPLSHAARQRYLDRLLEWASTPRVGRNSRRQMTAEGIRELADGGLVEIGAHTVTHPRLSAMAPDVQRDEVRRSKDDLELIVERPVTSFAYPFGGPDHYSANTVAFVKEAGFARACSAWAGTVTPASDIFQLPRVAVDDCDGTAFEHRVAAAFSNR